MTTVLDALLVVSGLGLVVTTVVDVARRPPHMTVLEGWGNPSGPRTACVAVFVVTVLVRLLVS